MGMNKLTRTLFIGIIVFSIAHTIRDIFQIYNIHNLLSDFYVTHDNYCGKYCDYVAFPVELFDIVGSIIVIRRNKIELLGTLVLLSMLFWPITLILS